MLLNPIIGYHFSDGWAISSSPEITPNWIASGNKWTVPAGGGVSKVLRIGEQPLKQRDPADRQPRPVAIAGDADLHLFRKTGAASSEEGTIGFDVRPRSLCRFWSLRRSYDNIGSTELPCFEFLFQRIALRNKRAHGTRQSPPAVHLQARNDLGHDIRRACVDFAGKLFGICGSGSRFVFL
jgi:hypothetical protein